MTLRKILLEGKTRLGVHVGIISRIIDDQYYVYAVESEYENINEGDIFTLGNTYCRDVLVNKQTMIYDDVAVISELLKHPCYLSTQLRAYIGTPLILNEQIWGTLNFSSLKPKQPEFTQADFATVEVLAQRVTNILEVQGDSELLAHSSVVMSK